MLDDTDRRLLRLVQSDPTLTAADLAERTALSAARCSRRLDRMQAAGVILGVEAVIDWAGAGLCGRGEPAGDARQDPAARL